MNVFKLLKQLIDGEMVYIDKVYEAFIYELDTDKQIKFDFDNAKTVSNIKDFFVKELKDAEIYNLSDHETKKLISYYQYVYMPCLEKESKYYSYELIKSIVEYILNNNEMKEVVTRIANFDFTFEDMNKFNQVFLDQSLEKSLEEVRGLLK